MKSLLTVLCSMIFLTTVGLQSCAAQDVAGNRVSGETITIDSKVLGESREIYISLPDGYQGSQQRYPVVYLLDGETHFRHGSGVVQFLASVGRIPQMIVVSIPNTDRARDLTPMHVAYHPSTGGAGNFLTFIESELFPRVAQRYRTTSQRILVGHSLGGMFAAYTLLTHPAMFQIYIAISPGEPATVQGGAIGSRYLLDLAAKAADKDPRLKGLMFVTVGDQETEPQVKYAAELADILSNKATQALEVRYDLMPGEDHGSIVHRALYNGLESAYGKLQLPVPVAEQGAAAVTAYYDKLASQFEFDGSLREAWINLAGYRLLQREKFNQAIDIFRLNVRLFPNSANVYDSLGEAFERSGQFGQALENYRQACAIAEKEHHQALATFKANLERMEKSTAQHQ